MCELHYRVDLQQTKRCTDEQICGAAVLRLGVFGVFCVVLLRVRVHVCSPFFVRALSFLTATTTRTTRAASTITKHTTLVIRLRRRLPLGPRVWLKFSKSKNENNAGSPSPLHQMSKLLEQTSRVTKSIRFSRGMCVLSTTSKYAQWHFTPLTS